MHRRGDPRSLPARFRRPLALGQAALRPPAPCILAAAIAVALVALAPRTALADEAAAARLAAADRALGLAVPWGGRAQIDSPTVMGPRFRGRLFVLRDPGAAGPRVTVQIRLLPDDAEPEAEPPVEVADPLAQILAREHEIVFGAQPGAGGRMDVAWWIPGSRRLRRVTGLFGTDLFADTLFAWEDLAWAASPERQRASGGLRHVERGGVVFDVVTSGAYHHFSRVETWIDRESGLPQRVRFFGAAGAPFRELRYEDVREVDGRRFPMRWVAEDLLSGARATVEFEKLRFSLAAPQRAWLGFDGMARRLGRGALPFPVEALGSRPAPEAQK